MRLLALVLLSLVCLISGASAQTVVCAPINGFSSMNREIVNANTGNSYMLDGRGCVAITSVEDLAFFAGQGIVQPLGATGTVGSGGGGGIAEYAIVGANGDGIHPDDTAFNNALNACSAGGGGTVVLDAKRYLLTQPVTIPHYCQVSCNAPNEGQWHASGDTTVPTTNWATTPFTVLLDGPAQINMQYASGWQRCTLLRNLPNLHPTNNRDNLTMINNFAGDGFHLQGAGDAQIRDTFIGGFTRAVFADKSDRVRLNNLNINARNCVTVNNTFDTQHWSQIHCWNFLSFGIGLAGQARYFIDSVTVNGAGGYRVHVSDVTLAFPFQAGDSIWVDDTANGAESMNNRYYLQQSDIVDDHTIDLPGSNASPIVGTGNIEQATQTISQFTTTPDRFTQIRHGQTVTGTGIPVSTTVLTPWSRHHVNTSAVTLSLSATSLQVGQTFTFTDHTWTAGGRLSMTPNLEVGEGGVDSIGYDAFNNNSFTCFDCFSWGHTIGYRMSGNSVSNQVHNGGVDKTNNDKDPNSIGYLFTGTSNGNNILGCGISGGLARPIVQTSPGGQQANTFSGCGFSTLTADYPLFEVTGGKLNISGSTCGKPTPGFPIMIGGDNNTFINLTGFECNNRLFFLQNGLANFSRFGNQGCNGTGCEQGTFAGAVKIPGQINLGAKKSKCGQSVALCFVSVDGIYGDASFESGGSDTSVLTPAVSQQYQINGTNLHSFRFHMDPLSATNRILALSLPGAIIPGHEINMYFEGQVVSLQWILSPIYVVDYAHPTDSSVASGTWIKCMNDFSQTPPAPYSINALPVTQGGNNSHGTWYCN